MGKTPWILLYSWAFSSLFTFIFTEQAGIWHLPQNLGIVHLFEHSSKAVLFATWIVWLFYGRVFLVHLLLGMDIAMMVVSHVHAIWRCRGNERPPIKPPAVGSGVVLITGASSGIGKDCAHAFAAKGWSVVLVARTESALEAAAKEIMKKHPKVKATVIPADLSQPAAAVDKIASELLRLELEVHILINNAGLDMAGQFVSKSESEMANLIAVNCTAPTLLTRRFLPNMIERGEGRVCFVSSLVSVNAVPGHGVYAASKAMLTSLADALRYEVEGTGVGVVNVLAGAVNTGFQKASGMADTAPVFTVPGYALSSKRVTRDIVDSVLNGSTNTAVTGLINQIYACILPHLLPRRLMMLAAERAMAPLNAPWRTPPVEHPHAD